MSRNWSAARSLRRLDLHGNTENCMNGVLRSASDSCSFSSVLNTIRRNAPAIEKFCLFLLAGQPM